MKTPDMTRLLAVIRNLKYTYGNSLASIEMTLEEHKDSEPKLSFKCYHSKTSFSSSAATPEEALQNVHDGVRNRIAHLEKELREAKAVVAPAVTPTPDEVDDAAGFPKAVNVEHDLF